MFWEGFGSNSLHGTHAKLNFNSEYWDPQIIQCITSVASFHRLHYNFSFARGESLGTRVSLLYRTDSYRQAETGYGTLTVKSCSGGNRGSPFSQWGPQFTRKMGTRENGGRSPFSRGFPKFYGTGIATDNILLASIQWCMARQEEE